MNGCKGRAADLMVTAETTRFVHEEKALERTLLEFLHRSREGVCSEGINNKTVENLCVERLAEAGLLARHQPQDWELTEAGRQVGTYLAQYQADEELRQMYGRLQCTEESVLLDLGCGAGPALVAACELPAPPKWVIGVDIDRQSLLVAGAILGEKQSRCLLVQADMAALPIRSEAVTHVCSRLSLPYVNQQAALAELGRVVRPKGKVFLQLHSMRFYFHLLWKEMSQWKRVMMNGFCLLNGLLFSLFSVQLKMSRKNGVYQELYQTCYRMDRILRRQGIAVLWTESNRLFRILGIKERK